MFRWYAEAKRCYVYLSDVSRAREQDGIVDKSWEDEFRASRWFRRGWTLQELLAPSKVEFFSNDGHSLGTKESLARLISEITHIPVLCLRGEIALSEFTVDERLLWQNGRDTHEPEDLIYSLLGIFEVSMPVLYGEGRAQARKRLLHEIEIAQKGKLYTGVRSSMLSAGSNRSH